MNQPFDPNQHNENSQANPYAAPKTHTMPPPLTTDDLFYVISKKKFIILTVATFGVYHIYWFWKHWELWKNNNDANIWPIARAIFAIFFTHKLFTNINEEAERGSGDTLPDLSTPATVYVVCAVMYQVIDKMTEQTPLILDAVIVIGFLVVDFWTLWQAQEQANIACGDPDGNSNDRLTGTNYVFIVLGTLVWLLFAIGVIADMTGVV